jgi:DNA replication protein DnaC
VFYARTSDLVQRLQAARRDLVLEAALAKLDKFDLIILDDITYAHKDQAETGVLFELIARRYEHRSIAIAANQPFSGWDQIFPDKAMTVAAIDRLVHHAAILEMNAESFRQRAATANKMAQAKAPATTTTDSHDEGESCEKTPPNTPTPTASKQAKVVVASGQDG